MVATTRRALSPVLALLLLLPLLAFWPSTPADAADFDNTDRIAASDYTATGIAVSKRVFPDGADAAVLTRDDHFPDALAASALAASVNGPVLFTDTDALTSSTAAELERILDGGDTVHITGGTAAVSQAVADELRDRGYEVSRLAGATRVETAAAIARTVGTPDSGHVLIARAFGPPDQDRTTGWVDSVPCGAYANHTTTPILLTRSGALDDATAAALDDVGATDATICGGEVAVSAQAAQDLRDAGLGVDRVWGGTRVETAVAVAEQLFGHSSADGHTYLLANGFGDNFGWGLAAAPLAGSLGAPILLVGSDFPTDCADETQPARNTLCHLETVGSGKADVIAVGPTAKVGDAVLDAAAEAAGGDTGSDGPPETPAGISTANVSSPSEGRVQVTWNAVDDSDVTGYNVYYGTGSPDTRAGSSTPTVPANATSFTVGALQLDREYTFAVTAVDDNGQESARSAVATETTTTPTVDLTRPSSASPVEVSPSSDVTVSFTYTASEGATYRLQYRADGDDTWFSFLETPDNAPGTVGPDDSPVTRAVTAPSDEGTYDVRVRLTPDGSGEAVTDVEVGSLVVNDPTVTITEPTGRTPVLQGDSLDVSFEFDTSESGTYRLFYKLSDAQDASWTEFPETADEADRFGAGDSSVSTVVTAPTTTGDYHLRVEVDPEGNGSAFAVEQHAFEVQAPGVTIDAPTGGVQVQPGGDVEVTFTANVDGDDYTISRRAADQEPEASWTAFDETNSDDPVTAGEQQTVTVTVDQGTGLYDLQVTVEPSEPEYDPLTATQTDAYEVAEQSTNDAVTLDQPTNSQPTTVDHANSSTFDIVFTYSTDADDRTYELSWSDDDGTSWETFEQEGGGDAVGDAPAGSDAEKTVTVVAPGAASSEKSYDVRVRLLDASSAEQASADEDDALTVAAASGGSAAPSANITRPTEPGTSPGPTSTQPGPAGTFTFEFDYANLPTDGTTSKYTVKYRTSGTSDSWQAFTDADGESITGADSDGAGSVQKTITAPHSEGEYDLRVEIDIDGDPSTAEASDEEPASLEVVLADAPPIDGGSGAMTVTVEGGPAFLAEVDETKHYTFVVSGVPDTEFRTRLEFRNETGPNDGALAFRMAAGDLVADPCPDWRNSITYGPTVSDLRCAEVRDVTPAGSPPGFSGIDATHVPPYEDESNGAQPFVIPDGGELRFVVALNFREAQTFEVTAMLVHPDESRKDPALGMGEPLTLANPYVFVVSTQLPAAVP